MFDATLSIRAVDELRRPNRRVSAPTDEDQALKITASVMDESPRVALCRNGEAPKHVLANLAAV